MFLISVVYFFWNLNRFNPLNLLSESYNTWYKFIILQKPGGIIALLDETWYAHSFPFLILILIYHVCICIFGKRDSRLEKWEDFWGC